MYLLDTNVVAETRRRHAMHPNVAAWLSSIGSAPIDPETPR